MLDSFVNLMINLSFSLYPWKFLKFNKSQPMQNPKQLFIAWKIWNCACHLLRELFHWEWNQKCPQWILRDRYEEYPILKFLALVILFLDLNLQSSCMTRMLVDVLVNICIFKFTVFPEYEISNSKCLTHWTMILKKKTHF